MGNKADIMPTEGHVGNKKSNTNISNFSVRNPFSATYSRLYIVLFLESSFNLKTEITQKKNLKYFAFFFVFVQIFKPTILWYLILRDFDMI